ncbi:hypothetical protein J6590_014073 [Homalodisca vitripennis]|nr:hypothetical protein J6590_014073 [Homalodisca vitripennis]
MNRFLYDFLPVSRRVKRTPAPVNSADRKTLFGEAVVALPFLISRETAQQMSDSAERVSEQPSYLVLLMTVSADGAEDAAAVNSRTPDPAEAVRIISRVGQTGPF